MAKLMNENVERLRYLLDKPGLANKMADAHNGQKALVSYVTFTELMEQKWVEYTTSNGKQAKKKVRLYPVTAVSTLKNAI